ncbi:MAG: demethoxyubiquinone hydroxylase family protein [Pseudomonadota bacterium]|nr:demethoxyubiquinone hydroxylase family protein [Pseudomonadota bacterium]
MGTHIPDTLPGLPGNTPPAQQRVDRMIRVNHAGEYGAKRIYEGQLAVLGKSPVAPVLEHMAQQEQHHLKAFEDMIVRRRVRPTALSPLWHVAGYALGAATALMGTRAAMACTVAVEEVIDEHYRRQLEQLPPDEAELRANIEKFRAEELEHRDIGLEHEAEKTPAYRLLSVAIKTASRTAIWLSERI